jgi:hypothetical protein
VSELYRSIQHGAPTTSVGAGISASLSSVVGAMTGAPLESHRSPIDARPPWAWWGYG